MGGGKGGGSEPQPTLAGYAYFLNMAYAFAERLDSINGFYLQETKVWSGGITENEQTAVVKTGINSEAYGSDNGPNTIGFYLGSQVAASALLTQATGKSIAYKNVCYIIFPQSFIGDNVRTVPSYGILGKRINMDSCSNLVDYNLYKEILGTSSGTTISTANPSYIIYDILTTLLKISPTLIEASSFEDAARVLHTEKIGINLVMNSSKKGIDWINECLRYIDSVFYFNQNIGKYTLKLLRDDYDRENLPYISIDIASNIVFTRNTRVDLPNTFTFKYAMISGNDTPKATTLSMTNSANLEIAGYVKNVDIDLTYINTQEALSAVTSAMFKKMSYPTASISFRISPLDLVDYSLGSVFYFYDEVLTLGEGIVFRVIKITGDSHKDSYINIEAIEDIFSSGDFIQVADTLPLETPAFYNLPSAPSRIKIFKTVPENASTKSVHVAATYPKTAAMLSSLGAYELTSRKTHFSPWTYGVVTNILDNQDTGIDYSLKIIVTDPDEAFYEINGTDADLQRLVYVAYWGEEAIGFKKAVNLGNGTFEFSGIIRAIQETKTTHAIGEAFWFPPTSGNAVPVLPITTFMPTIHCYGENQFNISPEITTTYTYTFSVETPYAPNSLTVKANPSIPGTGILTFTPCVRLRGANYRNCDTIVSGTDEGLFEGQYNIYYNGILEESIQPMQLTVYTNYPISKVGTWSVETQVGIYKSPKVTKVVVAADFIV